MKKRLMAKEAQAEAIGNGGREPLLLLVGMIGIVLGIGCLIVMLVQGNRVPPDGDWMKPVTFDLAVGLFIVTTAFILPFAGLGRKGRIVFRRLLAGTMLYWYGMETIQTYRGVDPRFGDGSFLKDELPGILFGVSSVWVIALYAALLARFFSRKRMLERPLVALGVRYGLCIVMLGFAAGIWMVALEGRTNGGAGSVMSIHFLGFHAFQAIPLIGWLLERSRLENARAKLMIHTAGWSWMMAVCCAAQQAYRGIAPSQPTFVAIVGFIGLLLCFAILVYAAVSTRKSVPAKPLGQPS